VDARPPDDGLGEQYRDECQQGIVQNGCKYFTDQSLELQGVNPFS